MKQNVILVDDDKNLTEGLKRTLRKENYNIILADSAENALEIMSGIVTDVVVTDEHMPGISGTAFLKHVRKTSPETLRIMLTGKANLETALRAINQGEIYRFFTKPCNEIDLAFAIREALHQKALIAQSKRLVRLTQVQSDYISDLERENPGISLVKKTKNGAIQVPQIELNDVLREVCQELDVAESRMTGVKKMKGH